MATDASSRVKVRRLPERGNYDREALYAILDEAFVCHVGFNDDRGPVVIPTLYARDNDRLVLHGSAASRMLRTLEHGVPVCVTVTLIDGLVLARSAFHHSVNYRSAVMFGTATLVGDEAKKSRALERLVEHIVPGRWDDARKPTVQEVKGTAVLGFDIEEFSVKARVGDPKDDEEDYGLPVWAGVLPLPIVPGQPAPDSRLPADIAVPPYIQHYTRPTRCR